MPNLPKGTGQLNIGGVRNDIIRAFRKLQKPSGPVKRRRKSWEVFEQIWNEWQASKARGASGDSIKTNKFLGRVFDDVRLVHHAKK